MKRWTEEILEAIVILTERSCSISLLSTLLISESSCKADKMINGVLINELPCNQQLKELFC
jgi:hypothetical protein